MNNFEDFLRDSIERGANQVRLVPRIDAATGKVVFYAHAQNVSESGETFEAEVSGKHVRRLINDPVSVPVPPEPESAPEYAGREGDLLSDMAEAVDDAARAEAAEAEVARAEAADAKAEAEE